MYDLIVISYRRQFPCLCCIDCTRIILSVHIYQMKSPGRKTKMLLQIAQNGLPRPKMTKQSFRVPPSPQSRFLGKISNSSFKKFDCLFLSKVLFGTISCFFLYVFQYILIDFHLPSFFPASLVLFRTSKIDLPFLCGIKFALIAYSLPCVQNLVFITKN